MHKTGKDNIILQLKLAQVKYTHTQNKRTNIESFHKKIKCPCVHQVKEY